MTCHNAPSKQLKSFLFHTKLPAFQHNIFVINSYKQVNPIHNSKRYKIKFVAVLKFILSAINFYSKEKAQVARHTPMLLILPPVIGKQRLHQAGTAVR